LLGRTRPLDLVRPLEDLGHLGVAHHSLHRVLGHAPCAAEDLSGLRASNSRVAWKTSRRAASICVA
jgi:hypothetical protein